MGPPLEIPATDRLGACRRLLAVLALLTALLVPALAIDTAVRGGDPGREAARWMAALDRQVPALVPAGHPLRNPAGGGPGASAEAPPGWFLAGPPGLFFDRAGGGFP